MGYSSAVVRDWVVGIAHGAIADAGPGAGRQSAFVLGHFAVGLLGFAALPFVLLAHPALDVPQFLLLAWPVLPLLAARDLLRHGDPVRANLISAGAICVAAVLVALTTGGPLSFAMAWLLLPPLQAALTGAERAVRPAAALSTASALGLVGAALLGLAPSAAHPLGTAMAVVVLLALLAYGLALALQRERQHRAAIAASRAERERERLIAASVSDLVTQHGTNGAVLAASLSAEALAGIAAEELIGQGLFGRVHVTDRPAFLGALARAAAGEADAAVEFRLRYGPAPNDGQAPRFVWVEMRCAPIRSAAAPDGGRYPVIAVTRDIGERKAREDELVVARHEADHANAAKSRFLATMSHELRTPLNAIIGFSELLTGNSVAPLDEARRREYAGLIHQSGMHLLSVVNGILDMSKIEAGSFTLLPEAVALEPLIADCVKLLALKAAEGGVLISMNVAPDLPELVADQRACKQILINLVSNAIKFSRAGGRVTIGAQAEGGSDVVLTVADTGVGISAEDLPRLGVPFFQAHSSYDRPYEGTGLGLSVVKGLAELHGGAVAITSTPGVGTRVVVRLPRVCKGATPMPAQPAWGEDVERVRQRA